MNPVEAFFRELDARLTPPQAERIELRIVGSTALFLQTPYSRGTKDCDAVETYTFDAVVKEALLAVGGKDSPMARRHGIYLEFVAEGILFLPEEPRWNPLLALSTLDLYALDPTDVVVAKLIRLHGDDLADIEAMVRLGLVRHERLVERFESAILRHGTYGRSDLLRPTIRKLRRVERDIFGVEESNIEIPEWMDA